MDRKSDTIHCTDRQKPVFIADCTSRLMRKSFTLPQGIVTLNIYDKEWLANAGIDHDVRVEAIEPGLSHQNSCKPIQDCHEAHTIGYCGSWLPRKGTELIKHDLPLVLQRISRLAIAIDRSGRCI